MPNDKLKAFYDAISQNPNITGLPKDYTAFESTMSDPNKSKAFYDAIKSNQNITGLPADYNSFSTTLGIGEPPGKSEPDGSGALSGGQQTPLEGQQTGSRVFDPIKQYAPQPQEQITIEQQGKRPLPKPVMSGDITGVYEEQIVEQPALTEARNYTKVENLKAKGADQFEPVRSKGIDIDKLVSKAAAPGKASLSVESAQANEAFRAIEDDYMGFLRKTNPEKAEYEFNRVNDIREQLKNGDSVNTAEEEILRDFRKNAIAARNEKAQYDILSVRQSSDVDTFQKQSTVLMNQLAQGKKEMEALGLNPNGENPPNKLAEAQKIIDRQDKILSSLDNLRQQTGFTEDKEELLFDSARTITDPVVGEYVNRQFPALKEQEDKNQREEWERYSEALVGGNWEVARSFSGAVGNAVMSIAQVPKVLGDATGDKDYDVWDELYNSTESLLKSKEGKFSRPDMGGDSYEELPLSYRMSRLFGEATGSVATFAAGGLAGGATKAGQFLATTGTAFLTGEADAYKDALAAGMNPQEAAIAGTTVNTVTSLIEGMIPDIKYFEPSAFRKSVMGAIRSGKTTQEAIRGAVEALPESAKAYLKTASKEGLEEGLGQLGSDVTKETINTMVKNDYQNVWDKEAYFESVLGGFMAGGGMQVFSRPQQKSPIQEDVLLSSIERKDAIVGLVETTNPEKAAEVDTFLTDAGELYEALKGAPSFEELPREKQAHVLSELSRKKQLEEGAKTIGVESESTIAEIAKIDEEVKSILDTGFTPTEIEEQKAQVKAEEERIKVEKETADKIEAELQAQPETLTPEEIKVKETLGEKIYTPEDIDTMLEEDQVIEKCPPGYVRKAANGAKTSFRPGGKWEIVHEFKGKSHKEGGIDIEIVGGKVKASNEDGSFKAEDGAVWQVDGAPEETEYEKAQRLGDVQGGLTTSVATAINPIVGGIVGLGQGLGDKARTGAEATDENGNLINRRKARTMGILGSFLDPLKALTTRASYKGGFGDITGNKYLASIESSAKANLPPEALPPPSNVSTAMQQQQQDVAGQVAGMRQQAGIQQPSVTMPQSVGNSFGTEMSVEPPQLTGGLQTIQINGGMYGYDSTGNFIKIA